MNIDQHIYEEQKHDRLQKQNADLIVKRKSNIGWPWLGMSSHGARSLLILLPPVLTPMLAGNAVTLVLQQLQGVAAL